MSCFNCKHPCAKSINICGSYSDESGSSDEQNDITLNNFIYIQIYTLLQITSRVVNLLVHLMLKNIVCPRPKYQRPKEARLYKFDDIKAKNVTCFLTVSLLMIVAKNFYLAEYLSTNLLLESPIFTQIIPKDKYLVFISTAHFNNNEESTNDDLLYKIRPIYSISATCEACLTPYLNIYWELITKHP